jgi:hypothetical protein
MIGEMHGRAHAAEASDPEGPPADDAPIGGLRSFAPTITGSASLCAALLLCGACAYRPPPVPPAEVIPPPVRRSDCAEMPVDEQGTCRKSSQSHGLAPANIGIARRRPISSVPPQSSTRRTSYVVFPVGSVFRGVPTTFSSPPSGVLGGDWSDFSRNGWSGE